MHAPPPSGGGDGGPGGEPAGLGADQLRVVQREEAARALLPDHARGVPAAALPAQHVQREGGPVVRLGRRP